MIFTFRLVSDESDDFMREIQIDADAKFIDLHDAVLDAAGYNRGQMSSFFICEEGWEKGKEITLEDMGNDSSEEVYLMDETTLSDFIEDEGQRLIFTFDYMTDRSFFMELRRTEPGQYLSEPKCTKSEGTAPPQEMDLDVFDAMIDAKAAKAGTSAPGLDLDDEFYGSTDFNDDEFDAGSFDEMDLSDGTL